MDSDGTDGNCHTDIGGGHGPGTSILQLDHGQPEGNQRCLGKISHYMLLRRFLFTSSYTLQVCTSIPEQRSEQLKARVDTLSNKDVL